ncbi:hypothetical protein NEMBOFW57_006200 [Staphylotrichum longicolle]|uniref:Acyltransferase 3 domain-containing protein n=1 Tax=Staphylotrichum longicolle TaxID=669026 RepID=A0AAD4F2W6_9PEZI|nr:hypothetical protein NEMBOFW57_006200 [Staphylotrichum longicolle]
MLGPGHRQSTPSTSSISHHLLLPAVIVFFCHYTENNFSALTPSYGLDPEHRPSSWLQPPLARAVFSGRPMVHIFFVVSGVVLSYKPVRALHTRETERCYAALASSRFRRTFRLFGPCVVSTFLILCIRQMGWFGRTQETLAEELWKWKGAVFHQLAWPWEWDRDLRPAYDVHLWTIPIEFVHLMLLVMVLLMLSRVQLGVRVAAVLGLMAFCLACWKWAGFEFLAGLFLADVYVLRAARAKEWEGDSEILVRVVGRGHCLGGGRLGFLRRLFESPSAQYCGRISYAVYI